MRVLTISSVSKNSPSPAIMDHLSALTEMYQAEFEHVFVHVDEEKKYQKGVKRFRQKLSEGKFDLVHAFYGYCGAIARLQMRLPVVVTFQGSDLLGGLNGAMHKRDGMIGRTVARFVNGVIVMSDEMREASGRSDSRVIPFGINTNIFHPQPLATVRRTLGLDLEKKYVLFPWHPDRPEKNFPIAKTAVDQLKREGFNIELLPLYARERSEVAQYMNACDVMVMVSDHEGSPVAVREALACNLPIVTVNVGDVSEFITKPSDGYIVKRRPDSVADKLRVVLASNQRADSSKKISKLNVYSSADEIYRVYQSVLNQPLPQHIQQTSLSMDRPKG